MTLLLQKEVAERIVAKDGKESLLSLSVKAYGQPKYVQTVKRGSFTPSPNVDSAIIHIANISREKFQKEKDQRSGLGDLGPTLNTEAGMEKNFFTLIHAGFAHKRKQLLPNLATLYSKSVLADAFEKLNIPLKIRAEDLPLQKWLELLEFI